MSESHEPRAIRQTAKATTTERASTRPGRRRSATKSNRARAPRPTTSPVEVALLDRAGVIVAVNDAWIAFARANGGDPERTGVGTSYLAACDAATDDPAARQVAAAINAAITGDLPAPLAVRMPCDAPGMPRTVDVLISSRLDDDGRSLGATVTLATVPEATELPTTPDPVGLLRSLADWALDRPALSVLLERIGSTAQRALGAAGATVTVRTVEGAAAETVSVGVRPDRPGAAARQVTMRTVGRDEIGQLCLHFDNARAAEALDSALLETFATLAGRAITATRRLERSELADKHIAWAAGVVEHLLSADAPRNPDVARRLVVDEARDLFVADGAVLVLAVDDATVQVRAATGVFEGDLGRTLRRAPDALDHALRTGAPVVEYDEESPTRPGRTLWVPLAGDRPQCVLGVHRATDGDFTPAEVAEARRFALAAGRALAMDAARTRRERTLLRDDRDRIAADLHDHVIQQLFAVGHGLDRLTNRLPDADDRARVNSYVVALDASVRRIRETIHRLHSDDERIGLRQRVIGVLDEEIVALGFAAHADFDGPVDTAVDEALADDAIAVIREALSNVARHARATSAQVSVRHREGVLTVEVVDDGTGATPVQDASGGLTGHGLANLHHRARNHDGGLEISQPPAGGTRLVWTARTRRLP